jgi:hypothetical protein
MRVVYRNWGSINCPCDGPMSCDVKVVKRDKNFVEIQKVLYEPTGDDDAITTRITCTKDAFNKYIPMKAADDNPFEVPNGELMCWTSANTGDFRRNDTYGT